MKKIIFCLVMIIGLLISHSVMSEPIIPAAEFPVFNSEWNLNNRGHFFTDGEYFFVNGGDGKVYRLDDQLQLGQTLFDDSVRGAEGFSYREEEDMLYFLADKVGKSKEGGLFRVKFKDGVVIGDVERLVKGVVSNYAINDQYICYHLNGYNGIYRINHDGSERFKLSSHEVQMKNPAIRMHIEDNTLYYINMKDHCLWSVPVDAQDSDQAHLFIERPMHYFLMVPYQMKGADRAEKVFIYVEYAPTTDELDKSHLAVVDMNGERISELDYLRNIQSRYINYFHGTLYYVDSSVDPQVPKWIKLDGEGDLQGTIQVEGQGDLKAFHAADGTHWKFNTRIGYIHVFDGWLVMNELGENFRYTNPRTGRWDITGGAGTDIWFVNLETLTSYRCKLKK